jgi:hypothetical protein
VHVGRHLPLLRRLTAAGGAGAGHASVCLLQPGVIGSNLLGSAQVWLGVVRVVFKSCVSGVWFRLLLGYRFAALFLLASPVAAAVIRRSRRVRMQAELSRGCDIDRGTRNGSSPEPLSAHVRRSRGDGSLRNRPMVTRAGMAGFPSPSFRSFLSSVKKVAQCGPVRSSHSPVQSPVPLRRRSPLRRVYWGPCLNLRYGRERCA